MEKRFVIGVTILFLALLIGCSPTSTATPTSAPPPLSSTGVPPTSTTGGSSPVQPSNPASSSLPVNVPTTVTKQLYTLSISVNPPQAGSVSYPSGEYEAGLQMSLIAASSSGYRFVSWSGDVSGMSSSVMVKMDSNKKISANFERIKYNLSTSVSPQGGGTISPTGNTHDNGTQVTLTATPLSGFRFVSWSGDASSTNPVITITIDSNKNVTANFEKNRYSFSISISPPGSGSVAPAGGTFDSGTQVSLTATPSSGYRFVSWAGDVSGTSSPIAVSMESNKSVAANFERIKYNLSISVSPQGGGNVSPVGGTYDSSVQVMVMATPLSGYRFVSWSGDVSGTSSSIAVSMDSNKNVAANFERIKYNLSISVSPQGGGNVSPVGGTYDSGAQVMLVATPSSGYQFVSWSGGVSGTGPTITLTMDSNKNVTANFARPYVEPPYPSIAGVHVTGDVSKPGISVKLTVVNSGGAGQVTVSATIGSETQTQTVYLKAHTPGVAPITEAIDVTLLFPDLRDATGLTYSVK